MKYLYFPGCSLSQHSTGRGYGESLHAIFSTLGVTMEEIEDWNCCGATSYMAVDELKAFGLASRNLALAEKQDGGRPIVAPCSACYMVLNKTRDYLGKYEEVREEIDEALAQAGLTLTQPPEVRHPLDVIINDVGLDTIKKKVKAPLEGLKVCSYYGCLLVRPYAQFDDPITPRSMDNLMKALGAEPVYWPVNTRCCGGALTGTLEEVGLRLNYILLREAKRRGADCIATACPFCQFNLECFQKKIMKKYKEDVRIPVVFFTQLLGLSLGLNRKTLALHRLFVPFPFQPMKKGGSYAIA